MNPTTSIAVIEDDDDIADIIVSVLAEAGYQVRRFATAASFHETLKTDRPTLCLIDLGLPDENGLDLVRLLSNTHNIPNIIISGKRALTDKLIGLELGADDYIAKPFESAELVARVRTVLRRAGNEGRQVTAPHQSLARFQQWTIDFNSFRLIDEQNNEISLNRSEVEILRVFLNRPHQLLSRSQILEHLQLDVDSNFDRSIDVRISRLRNKLGEDRQNPKIIKTVYGEGYLFAAVVTWVQS
ncbi:response regulator transcription factor [Granulosicoccus antarcticus]|uniref:Transcriptional regulatory protein OmpR n=1 Tax=Granulosicoccus antarcticus IMCC3135 TaxID=1192854 RepID=A0A2Z2NT40_9GAMM|nr:response regulator transcription factor [Granulosicoccus antarcticus]ASJ74479.1 Transcriptional regulatory protein OmpR [Granulosicoccus antarcticus IMCC3135]